MKQLNHTLFSADPINLESVDKDYRIYTDINELYLTNTKTRTEERLDDLYDLIERLEYRVVELENKINDLEKPLSVRERAVTLTSRSGMQYIGTNEDGIKMYLA